MTVAPLALPSPLPRRGWLRFVPRSWVMMAGGDVPRERDRDLDETASMRQRRWDDAGAPPPPPKVQVPIGVVVSLAIYLVGQLVTGVWWAATLQSDVRHLQGKNTELWQLLETEKLKNERLTTGFDEKVRAKVREVLDDWGYLRVRGRKEE